MSEDRKFKHLMVDLETMGIRSNSSIVSIAAVEFDLDTGETGEEFYKNVSLQSCVNLGMKMDPETIMWWLKQSDDARAALTSGKAYDISDVLNLFSIFCDADYEVWGNSARFDLGILANAYDLAGIPIPWNQFKERCVRTLASFQPSIKKSYVHEGTDHNALSDCYKQIGYCSRIWNTLQKEKQTN